MALWGTINAHNLQVKSWQLEKANETTGGRTAVREAKAAKNEEILAQTGKNCVGNANSELQCLLIWSSVWAE